MGLASGANQLVDDLVRAEVEAPVRPRLYRENHTRPAVDGVPAPDRPPVGGETDPPDLTGVVRAEEQAAAAPGSQPAVLAERRAHRGDRRNRVPLGFDRGGSVPVRVARRRRRGGARRRRPPSVIAAGTYPVQLVVALGPVLGLPEIPAPGIEREPEAVPDPVGVDAGVPQP